jgi:hypothetical protein
VDEDEQDGAPSDDMMNMGGDDGGFGGIDFSRLGAGGTGDMDMGGADDDDVRIIAILLVSFLLR